MRQLYGSHVNCMHFTVAYVCVREGGVGERRARDSREPRFLGNDVGVVARVRSREADGCACFRGRTHPLVAVFVFGVLLCVHRPTPARDAVARALAALTGAVFVRQ